MSGHGSKMQSKREEAILSLLQSGSIETTAKQIGVAVSTLARWMKQEQFQRQYHAARQHVFQTGLMKMAALTGTAVSTLESIMTSPLSKPSSKVQAAKVVLDVAVRVIAEQDLEERLRCLEHASQAHKGAA